MCNVVLIKSTLSLGSVPVVQPHANEYLPHKISLILHPFEHLGLMLGLSQIVSLTVRKQASGSNDVLALTGLWTAEPSRQTRGDLHIDKIARGSSPAATAEFEVMMKPRDWRSLIGAAEFG